MSDTVYKAYGRLTGTTCNSILEPGTYKAVVKAFATNGTTATSDAVQFTIQKSIDTDTRKSMYAAKINTGRGVNDLAIYSSAFGAATNTNEYGVEYAVGSDGIVISKSSAGKAAIPSGGFVLSGHGTSQTWLNNNVSIGDKIAYSEQTLKVVVSKDNSDIADTEIKAKTAEEAAVENANYTRFTATGIDRGRGLNCIILFTSNYGAKTGTNEWGAEYVVDKNNIVTAVYPYGSSGNATIPSGGFVISAMVDISYWLNSKISVGDVIHFDRETLNIYIYDGPSTASSTAVDWRFAEGDFPSQIALGEDGKLQGKVFCNQVINSAQVELCDGNMKSLYVFNKFPNKKNFDLSEFNSQIDTSAFSAGQYYIEVLTTASASDNGTKYHISKWFTVGDLKEKYILSYDANGGTGAPTTQTKTEEEALTLSADKPTRYGYSFLGWSTDRNASAPEYRAGGEFNIDANTALFAVWGACDHSYGAEITGYSETHPHYAIYKCNNCDHTTLGTETQTDLTCNECIFSVTALDGEKCKITGYTGAGGEMTIPSEIGGMEVYSTNTGAFKNNTSVTSVNIEEGLTEIGGLSFMGCSSLKKATIPESVTTIGAYAFYECAQDLVIYCYKNSAAYNYAVENSIDYFIMDVKAVGETIVDYDSKLIFTSAQNARTLNELILPGESIMLFPVASVTFGNTERYGTGTSVSAFDNNKLVSDYTVIVKGDLNGDSVCDILDVAATEKYASDHGTATQNQIYAANGCVSEQIDVSSFQTVVNSALAS